MVAAMDPLVAQGFALVLGAVAMAITSIVAYYFPRGHDRFDHDDERREQDERET